MVAHPSLVTGTLQRRYKRFLADVTVNGETLTVHCPNSGAMTGLVEPGTLVALKKHASSTRRYPYSLELVKTPESWVGVNTHLANTLMVEALENKYLPSLKQYTKWRREVTYASSRLDFLLQGPEVADCYLEVKSVTLKEGEKALFPDAVTTRGQKHLKTLMVAKEAGFNAIMAYVVQREDCASFSLAAHIDPCYANLAREAQAMGVVFVAVTCQVSPEGVRCRQEMKVEL